MSEVKAPAPPPPDGYVTSLVTGFMTVRKSQNRNENEALPNYWLINAIALFCTAARCQDDAEDLAAARKAKHRDPTAADIAKAKANMPVINMKEAPKCNCGLVTRPRKCKARGKGFGLMFWWCPKTKADVSRCKYISPLKVQPPSAAEDQAKMSTYNPQAEEAAELEKRWTKTPSNDKQFKERRLHQGRGDNADNDGTVPSAAAAESPEAKEQEGAAAGQSSGPPQLGPGSPFGLIKVHCVWLDSRPALLENRESRF
eukprot:gene19629-22465_t